VTDLTNKQKAFIEEYLKDFNATRAAERAGYQGNDATLGAVGYENLRKPQLAERISQRLQEIAMSADEVLARLADQARGDIGDFVKIIDGTGQAIVDLEKAKAAGKLHLVKKIRYNAKGGLEIELYDAQAALSLLGKTHGLFKDRVDITSGDQPLEPTKIVIYEYADTDSAA
jgi:phage terminase small subunit